VISRRPSRYGHNRAGPHASQSGQRSVLAGMSIRGAALSALRGLRPGELPANGELPPMSSAELHWTAGGGGGEIYSWTVCTAR